MPSTSTIVLVAERAMVHGRRRQIGRRRACRASSDEPGGVLRMPQAPATSSISASGSRPASGDRIGETPGSVAVGAKGAGHASAPQHRRPVYRAYPNLRQPWTNLDPRIHDRTQDKVLACPGRRQAQGRGIGRSALRGPAGWRWASKIGVPAWLKRAKARTRARRRSRRRRQARQQAAREARGHKAFETARPASQ